MVGREETGLTVRGFKLSRTGMEPSGKPTLKEWKAAGKAFRQVDAAVHWWIGDWLNYGEQAYGEKYKEVIEETGFSYKTLAEDKYVSGSVEFSIRMENLSWGHHQLVAPFHEQPAQQKRLLEAAEKNGWSVSDLRQHIRAVRRQKAKQEAGSFPEGTYPVVLTDPPWEYDFAETECREIENQYPTMPVEEIEALADSEGQCVTNLFTDDCVLFCWTTSPKLREGLRVLEAWGFGYKTCMVWVKDKIGMGYYARQRHELLLIATKGTPAVPEPERRPDSVVVAPRTEHSRKPVEVYELIESMYPDLPRLEIFSRNNRNGWASWGNQV